MSTDMSIARFTASPESARHQYLDALIREVVPGSTADSSYPPDTQVQLPLYAFALAEPAAAITRRPGTGQMREATS